VLELDDKAEHVDEGFGRQVRDVGAIAVADVEDLTNDRARTASRSELRDNPRLAARSGSRGNRWPGRSSPELITTLSFSMALSVTATIGSLRTRVQSSDDWP